MLKWVSENKDVLLISQFFTHKGISVSTYERWARRNKNLKDAITQVKTIISERRELGALKKQFEPNIFLRTIRQYNSKWTNDLREDTLLKHKHDKELIRLRAELNVGQEDDNKNSVVVIERYPSSDKVPERPTRKVEESDSEK